MRTQKRYIGSRSTKLVPLDRYGKTWSRTRTWWTHCQGKFVLLGPLERLIFLLFLPIAQKTLNFALLPFISLFKGIVEISQSWNILKFFASKISKSRNDEAKLHRLTKLLFGKTKTFGERYRKDGWNGWNRGKGGGSPLNRKVCGGRGRGRAVSRAGRIVIIQHVCGTCARTTTGDIGSRSRSPHNGSNRREECRPTLNLLPPRPVTKIKAVRNGTRR